MGLKCSVLGHRFDETAVERERHEEGTEVVITITEVETCSRCGESRIVSENKEVTALESSTDAADAPASAESTADGPAATPDAEPDARTGAGAEAGAGAETEAEGAAGAPGGATPDDRVTDDAEIIDASGTESSAQATARSEAEVPDADADPDTDAVDEAAEDDDAVIIDSADDADAGSGPAAGSGAGDPAEGQAGGATDGQRQEQQGQERGQQTEASGDGRAADASVDEGEAGAWPDEPDSEVGEPADAAEWPDDDPRTDEPLVERASGSGFGSGSTSEWPEATRRDPGADSTADGPALEPTEGATITVPEGMFKCSECGFTTEVESSSLRAGDFCPECQQGTLVQDADADPDAS